MLMTFDGFMGQAGPDAKERASQDALYDLPESAKLEKTATDCVGCDHCDRRCPFHVKQAREDAQDRGLFRGFKGRPCESSGSTAIEHWRQ